jgi:hypothetical protein
MEMVHLLGLAKVESFGIHWIRCLEEELPAGLRVSDPLWTICAVRWEEGVVCNVVMVVRFCLSLSPGQFK